MPFEDVRTVEALFRGASRAGAEAAHHSALVVGQGVSVLVVLAGKAFGVVFASGNWALLRALVLVREHVRLEVLEVLAACGVWAKAFVGFVGRRSLAVA